jgi:hypothetical protein
MIILFIDSNVFLSFYHLTNEDLEELRKPIALIDSGHIKLLVTKQVENEFVRNRGNKIANAMRKLQSRAPFWRPLGSPSGKGEPRLGEGGPFLEGPWAYGKAPGQPSGALAGGLGVGGWASRGKALPALGRRVVGRVVGIPIPFAQNSCLLSVSWSMYWVPLLALVL